MPRRSYITYICTQRHLQVHVRTVHSAPHLPPVQPSRDGGHHHVTTTTATGAAAELPAAAHLGSLMVESTLHQF